MATSFSSGGSRSTRREPPTLGKQLVNFITCGGKVALSTKIQIQIQIHLHIKGRSKIKWISFSTTGREQ
jgi:hypothetical protein